MKNLELKVELHDLAPVRKFLSDHYQEDLHQTDTYFVCDTGRLKLREERGKEAYMIYYHRPNVSKAKYSEYHIFPIPDVDAFRKVFSGVLNQQVVVKKRRELYIIDEPCYTRIHLDTVKKLGTFLEIEITLDESTTTEIVQAFMEYLMELLKIKDCPKIDCGYRELILNQNVV